MLPPGLRVAPGDVDVEPLIVASAFSVSRPACIWIPLADALVIREMPDVRFVIFGEGELHDTVVACPWHGWQFDVTNGRNVFDPTLAQCTYAVKLEGGNILLSVP